MGNSNLHKAMRVKNDEFYTQLIDIENELKHYEEQFRDKIILCNCDDATSNFYHYFSLNFKRLGLKELIIRDGDFRSATNIEFLKQADVVVTNPPFSLFREYVQQLMKYNKKFLIIGNQNNSTYNEIFPLVLDNKIWLGVNAGKMSFLKPNENGIQSFGNICWFTNIKNRTEKRKLILTKSYNPIDYPKYDHYDAINVNKIKDIPKDYDGLMGVPITFFTKYNTDQFEIIDGIGRYSFLNGSTEKTKGKHLTQIGDKLFYSRIIIKRKDG